MKKIRIIVAAVVAILILFFILNRYVFNKRPEGDTGVGSYRATLTGEYVCLPNKDKDIPETADCASGIKTEDGEYYAIDFTLMSQEMGEIETTQQITANGLLTPVERLSSKRWQQYDVDGVFFVTDSVEIWGGIEKVLPNVGV